MWYPSVLPGRNNNETRWCLLKTNLFELCNTCVFLQNSNTFPSSLLPPPHSDATGLWSVSLVILGFVSGPLLQRGCSPPHPLHPFAAGQCWHPLPRAGGTGWMCTTQLYETPVTHSGAQSQMLPVFNTGTLMLLLLDWEMLLHLEHCLDNAKDGLSLSQANCGNCLLLLHCLCSTYIHTSGCTLMTMILMNCPGCRIEILIGTGVNLCRLKDLYETYYGLLTSSNKCFQSVCW